ncbi:CARDB domain-containing protein [Natronobiforma cellulositropha]|uniref:CARDB domain-containing protein n=1 Tax=Natronobiforma cellulositropha TaxID=1679076 RepID=UPI0021D5BC05|nr:CARDB domain-containing protein [Natronobiforma cellulositropha]
MTRRALLAIVLCCLCCLGAIAVGGGGVAGDAGGVSDTAEGVEFRSSGDDALGALTTDTGERETIEKETVVRHLPDSPGEFEAEVHLSVPETVTELELRPDAQATVVSSDGFEAAGGVYRWDGETAAPALTYRVAANRTHLERHHHSPEQGDGYYFVDAGSWALVAVPSDSLEWWQTAPTGVERTVTVDGPGATGGSIAFLGEAATYERETSRESIELVVPATASMSESPEDVLDALEEASDALGTVSWGEEVFFVAAPTRVEWAAGGIQYGERDAWVRDDAPLAVANGVWLHEYVHTQQDFAIHHATAAETAWLVEAQAEYYAALLALESGLIEYRQFERFLSGGQRSPYADGVLADRSSWHHESTDYVKGPLVYGAIDRQLRLASDGEYSSLEVFRDLNQAGERVTAETYYAALERYGNPEVRAFAERYVETAAVPETWSAHEHRTAFEGERALFTYGLGDASPTVSGPYRTGPIALGLERTGDGGAAGAAALVPGETVHLPVTVENVGERDGTYDARVVVDGALADQQRGELAAGERDETTLAWTPSRPGSYELRVGDERFGVDVRSPADVRVSDLTVEPDRVDPGEPAQVVATVANDADRPANATLRVRTPDGIADEWTVALGPGESATLETAVSFPAEGRYELAVGEHTAVLDVGGSSIGAHAENAADALPGFGVLLASAVVVLVAVARARRTN